MINYNLQDRRVYVILTISALILGTILGTYIGFNGLSVALMIIVLVIPFLTMTINKLWIAICIFFLMIPMENLYSFEGGISTVTKLMGAYLFFLLITTGSLNHIHEVFKNKKVLWLMVYGTSGIISLLSATNISNSISNLVTLWLSIFLYFVLIMMIRDVKTLHRATWALVTGGVISILIPFLIGFSGLRGAGILKRYGGLWGDQNEFAAVLLMLLPLSIFLFLVSKKKIVKLLAAMSTIIIFIGSVLTYSRGGFVAFCILCILTLVKFIKGRNRVKVLGIVLPCLIFAFAIFYFIFADQFISRVETLRGLENIHSVNAEGSLKLRYIYYFELAPKLFKEHPLLGVGIRGFISHNPHHQVSHNTFLEILIGTGLLGFIPFIMILYFTWKELNMLQKYSYINDNVSYLSSYATALELGFIPFLVSGLFVSLDSNKFLWLSISLSSVLVNIMRMQIKSTSQGWNRDNQNNLSCI